MLGLLKRHEVKVLLKADHRKAEVVGLAGVSRSCVKRIGDESPVVHVDDAAERAKRRIGRPSRVEGFRERVVEILREEPDLPSPPKYSSSNALSAASRLVALLTSHSTPKGVRFAGIGQP